MRCIRNTLLASVAVLAACGGENLEGSARQRDPERVPPIAMAERALELCVDYARERKQFGRPIGQFQMIQQKLADMKTRVEASRLLVYQAALAKIAREATGERYTLEASMAKLFASETAMWIANQAVQIHGGMGYSKEMPIERYFRDAKITEIYEGTSEIQRLVIARELMKQL